MITLRIDDHQVNAKEGQTVFEAAQGADIYIPSLCYSPDLKPYGGCRLCVVEIEKMRGLPTACTTPVVEGMVVRTYSGAINEARRGVIDLIISDHPMDCLTCVKNTHCELQRVAAYIGVNDRRLPRIESQKTIDESNPFFKLDRNYCILCARCTRTCDEITGVNAIEIIDRGLQSRVSTAWDKPLTESICRSCGECMVHCPVAALTPKEIVRPDREVKTTCPYCAVGCQMFLGVTKGKVVEVRGDPGGPSNGGLLCVKGRFGIAEVINDQDRLKTPLIKREGKFIEASWDEALDLVAGAFKKFKPDEIGMVSSARSTNEENYVTQKFARVVLGTNNIDHCARL